MSMMQTGCIKMASSGVSVGNSNTSSFTDVKFSTPFPAGSEVIVIPMVQTFNGADTPGVRLADVTTTGFKIRMNELVVNGGKPLSDGNHITETIGWVAFTANCP